MSRNEVLTLIDAFMDCSLPLTRFGGSQLLSLASSQGCGRWYLCTRCTVSPLAKGKQCLATRSEEVELWRNLNADTQDAQDTEDTYRGPHTQDTPYTSDTHTEDSHTGDRHMDNTGTQTHTHRKSHKKSHRDRTDQRDTDKFCR